MRLKRSCKMIAGALLFGIAGFAQAANINTETTSLQGEMAQLRDSNQSLQRQITELRQVQGENWLNERRAEEVKSLVREVLADADTRASLLEGGMTAGHNGKHFFLASEDGSFLMKIAGQIQFRYIAAFRSNTGAARDGGENGFSIRRTKINFSGHIGNPRFTYEVQLEVNRGSNDVGADKIKIGYKIDDNWSIWFGEDKAPFLREELISSKRQLAVERSVVNETFTLDKVQGIALKYKSDMFRGEVMLNDGSNSGNGNASTGNRYSQSLAPTSKDFDDDRSDFAITARIDVKIQGNWKQMKDFTAWHGEDTAIFVGAAVHYELGESGDTGDNNNFFQWTVDGSIESQGANIYAAVMGMHTNNESGVATTNMINRDMLGFLIQGGYQIVVGDNTLEPFVRYEFIDFDGDPTLNTVVSNRDQLSIITFGANYYLKKHAAKVTLDVVWALDEIAAGHSGLGLNNDAAGQSDQIVIRFQYQLLF